MDFTFDLATNQLIPTNGVDEITLKWRSREPVRIHFHRDGTDELLPSGFGLALYLKRSTTMLATCTSFTAPGTAAGYYTGTLILNTDPLTTAFTTATVLSIAAKVEAHWWASGESASPSISDSVVSAQIVRPVVAPEPSSVETVTLGYEGTDIKSTGETGGAKYLREDGDGTCSWQSPSGSGDALVANNLDQFASVTQTAGQTLAITASTTLAGGTHSGTNTGDQSLAAYLTSTAAATTYQPLDADLTSIAGLTKAGNTLKVIRVNAGETAYELATVTSGSGDALVANNLDQFASVTQTAGQTLAITSSTTLSGGTHSGTNTGDQSLAAYATLAAPVFTGQIGTDGDIIGQSAGAVRYSDGQVKFSGGANSSPFHGGVGGTILTYGADADGQHGGNGGNLAMYGTPGQNAGSVSTIAGGSLTMGTANIAGGNIAGTILTTAGSAASLTDFPTLNQNTTGSAATLTTARTINGTSFNGSANITVTAAGSTLSDTVPTTKGGTGLTTIGTALQVLRTNAGATALEFATLAGGGNAQTADPLSQFAATTSAQLAGVMSDETGSGALVFATSPTLTTPTIGDGTESAPSLSFTSDANTGVYRPAADTVGIVGGGNDVVRMTGIASATDYIEIKNGIGVGSPIHVLAEGASANIGMHLQPKGSGLFTISDGTDFNKGIRFRSSSSAASAVTLIDAVSTAGRVITLPDATGTLALVSGDLGTPSALVGTNATGTAANLTAGQATAALGIKSATTTVSVSAATAPTDGQVLTATSGTAATWQTPSGGGGLTNITETLVTSAPNATVNAEKLAVTGGTTNADLVLCPKGTGAFILGPSPDSTGTGGNKRGTYAIDLQISKSATADRVASGNYSLLAGVGGSATGEASVSMGQGNLITGSTAVGLGYGNSASGLAGISLGYSNTNSGTVAVALGQSNIVSNNRSYALGYSNTASGDASGAMGDTCTASAKSALATGLQALASRYGQRSHSAGQFAAVGDAQAVKFVLRCKTTTNAAVEMMLDGSATRLTIISGKVLSGIVQILGMKSDGTVAATYLRQVAIKNVAGTTSLIGTVNTLGTDETGATSLSITANDTNDAINISPTGIAAQTWRWIATFDGIEVAYGA